ncbi:hypothetical protein [Paenibacillus sp. PDC88]|uniref:Uncharacterized protein n=1 Tax=Paenibacillus provencensis TaxID=441151 RepID=A0ABW3PWB8_9BACL|nr:hypothetical protein [Paenibacillus sp. PDC88]SDX88603.1 E2 family protein D [Paenibacillus sp. PDC88]
MSQQHLVEKNNTGNEMVIRIRDHYALPIVEEYIDGVKVGEGIYTHEAVASAILQSLETGLVRTPVMPRGALHFVEITKSRKFIFMEVSPQNRKAYYHEAVIEEVPFPRLVFGFEIHERDKKWAISQVYLAALEDQIIPNEESMVFFYPYTNVKDNFQVCWGSQQLPDIERLSQLSTFPELFFNSPNSDCYYYSSNNSNMNYRELVTKIKGESFPQEYLKPTNLTLQAWFNRIVGFEV